MTVKTKAKTFESWMRHNFTKDEMKDIAEHGASCGFPGLTYYSDTVSLHDTFEDDIWDALYEECENMGSNNVMELIASFGGAKDVGSIDQFKNLLVWFMAERIAYRITES